MKRDLERVEIPDEHEASDRTWRLVQQAYAEHEPVPPARRRPSALVITAIAAGIALIVVGVSPAGPALVRSVRHAVGIEHADQALVELPAPGRLLVNSRVGPWIVGADGSKRLLGRYGDAGWSPHGLYEVAARGHELAALDPKGSVAWSLERAGTIHDPRWSPDGYRIAYLVGGSLRVVAGDGTGDRRLANGVAPVAPAWRPGTLHVLAYATLGGLVRIVDTDTGASLGVRHGTSRPTALFWSADGRLVVVRDSAVLAAAAAPAGHRYALVAYDAAQDRSTVVLGGASRRTLFQGTGRIDSVAWSPNGRWLLLAWRTADQWVFVPLTESSRIHAVAGISAQFHSTTFPQLAGWCC